MGKDSNYSTIIMQLFFGDISSIVMIGMWPLKEVVAYRWKTPIPTTFNNIIKSNTDIL